MTAQDRATLKTKFEQGDKPQGSDYNDWIDSSVMLAETSVQAMSGNLQVPTIIATNVSAGTLYGDAVLVSAVNASTVSAQTATVSALSAVTGDFTDVSAQSVATSGLAFVTASGGTGTVNNLTIVSGVSFSKVAVLVTASPGAAGAVPASAQGYLEATVSGTAVLIPYFVKPTI